MKILSKGYTLLELIMAVSLLVIVLTGGTAIFYRSFRSSGLSDVQTVVNNSLRTLDEMIERSLRYGVVYRVSSGIVDNFRNDCLLAGSTGVAGNTLVVKDSMGGDVTYSLLPGGTVSSNSGVIISNPGIIVTKLQFTWICKSGVNDKMNLDIEANASGKSGEVATSSLKKDINLLNSGIN